MFEALHPYENRLITYSDYLEFALESNCSKPNDAKGARCPVCTRLMKVRSGHKKGDGHFCHKDDKFCPTKAPAGRPYIGLPPSDIDPIATKLNQEFAQNNLSKIWNRLQSIVPFIDFKEFIDILAEAKRLRVYSYANLEPKLLPYVYVTLINFLPNKSFQKKRKLKFCFFYESEVQTYGDLWINQGSFSRLTRISYNNGKTQRVTLIDTNTAYLEREQDSLSQKQLEWCIKIM
ncbi:hypothetical protein CWC05_09230 [Pseudoalteromonas ruthenica]|uniref:Uncharacterized protein n=1 Tax=Pseudoalteromonas ruthenica TaxID=151081 RepID=A0A5S3Z4S2_9GAMM|nr:hypothetical protein [Pseudoalteromonas ruthenica]TMP87264.1 hypothetical protein CWC05_09230 [Pseudoalteromonas ruthenica]